VIALYKKDRLNSLISFKLRGTELQKLDEYCDAQGFTRSELMREFVQSILAERAPVEDTNAG
jgi:metal-responsive CopG/Arc/MetJ family transcriptional regulator